MQRRARFAGREKRRSESQHPLGSQPQARRENIHHVRRDRDLLLPKIGVGLSSLTTRVPPSLRASTVDLLELAVASRLPPSALLESPTGGTTADPPVSVRGSTRSTEHTSLHSSNLPRVAIAESTSDDSSVAHSLGSRVVQDSSLTPIPILDQALGNLSNSETNALGRTGNLDDALRRLREHVLGGDHAGARDVLDLTNLGSSLADDGADEEVGDEQTDGGGGGSRRGGGVGRAGCGDGVLEDGLGDEGVGLFYESERRE